MNLYNIPHLPIKKENNQQRTIINNIVKIYESRKIINKNNSLDSKYISIIVPRVEITKN